MPLMNLRDSSKNANVFPVPLCNPQQLLDFLALPIIIL